MTDEMKQENPQASSEASSQSANEVFDPDIASKEDWLALVARKDEEIGQMQDKLLRMAAEMENTRKRLERERSEGICFANESLIRNILPVLDNLERALQHAKNDANTDSLTEGVQMTLTGFLDTLARFGCAPFESEGKPFDPNYHEAMMQEESAEYDEPTVVRELEKGYTLQDRLLRPAKVIVSKAAQKPPEKDDEGLGDSSATSHENENSSGNKQARKIPISVETS